MPYFWTTTLYVGQHYRTNACSKTSAGTINRSKSQSRYLSIIVHNRPLDYLLSISSIFYYSPCYSFLLIFLKQMDAIHSSSLANKAKFRPDSMGINS